MTPTGVTPADIATGMVWEFERVSIVANKKSFQERMKERMAVETIPGAEIGSAILRNVCIREQPSTAAESSNSLGTSKKKLLIIKTAKGRVKDKCAMITDK